LSGKPFDGSRHFTAQSLQRNIQGRNLGADIGTRRRFNELRFSHQ
jgi:hypothetical protein